MINDIQYDADVLIAGGGPSGALCAYYLAKAGKKVIIIDAENFPRDKVCGDFVSPVGLTELMHIGISGFDEFEKTNKIACATVHLDGQAMINKNLPQMEGLPDYGRVIPRLILDNWIIAAAQKQGAQLITPCRLKQYTVENDCVKIECSIEDKDRVIYTRLLIGADGSNSIVARILNGKKPEPENKIIAVRAYFENINCVANQAELFFSSKSFPGYYWFFPTGATTANVGIGMMLENFPKSDINLTKLLMDMIDNDAAFKARIGAGRIINKVVGFPLSIYNPRAVLVKDRVLLTGDAAGLINSINGEGIQYALQSGRWAAECVINCLATDDLTAKSLSAFVTKVNYEIGYDMSISNIVMQFIRNRNLNPLWLCVLRIMIAQAEKDEKYASIAGGILAGMVPGSTALHWYFLRKSIARALIYPFIKPSGIFKHTWRSIIFVFKSLSIAYTQKVAYWNWIKNIIKSIIITLKLRNKIAK